MMDAAEVLPMPGGPESITALALRLGGLPKLFFGAGGSCPWMWMPSLRRGRAPLCSATLVKQGPPAPEMQSAGCASCQVTTGGSAASTLTTRILTLLLPRM